MPELPEVQTIIDDLADKITGKRIVEIDLITPSVWRDGIPQPELLLGTKIKNFERAGKHILIHLSNKNTIIIHLKMTGKLTVNKHHDPISKHTHLVIKFARDELRFNDVRRFGYLDCIESSQLSKVEYLARLGPDSLKIPADEFIRLIRSRKRTIKSLLLDQEVIAGLGNIYSDEALFAARIDPSRSAGGISTARLKKLHGCILAILQAAIKARGSSVSNYVDGSGKRGDFQKYHKVYGRSGQPCVRCGTSIKKRIISGRSSHFCSRCQR